MLNGIPLILVAIAIGFACSAGLLATSLVPAKSDMTKRLEELEGLRFETGSSRTKAFENIFNDKQRGALKRQLQEAGWYTVTPAQMGVRIVAGGVFGFTAGVSLSAYMHSFDTIYIGAIVLMTFAGAYFPLSKLKSAVKGRKIAIVRALPDLLDMLASMVQAGQSFNAAIASAQEIVPGPLQDEIRAYLSEVRLGRSRAEALRSMAGRIHQEQITTTVTAIIQAEHLGSNLANVLDQVAEEVRDQRMTRAEEIANLMPTKMVIPMALFMLPALFVMIFGAVFAEYLSSPH